MPGHPVATALACAGCGRPLHPDDRFCSGCGASLDQAPAPAPPHDPAPAQPPSAAAGPPPAPGVAAVPPPAPPGSPAVVTTPSIDVLARSIPGGLPQPSAIGRRASGTGWVGVVVIALLFAGASTTVVIGGLQAGRAAGHPSLVPSSHEDGRPVARFDDRLYDGSTVIAGEPFDISVAAGNPADRPTDPVWLVLDWRPDDRAGTASADGVLIACVPDECTSEDDTASGTTTVRWPGLAPGAEATYTVTVLVTGLDPGATFEYRATTGSGPTPASIGNGYTWDLDLAVEAPEE